MVSQTGFKQSLCVSADGVNEEIFSINALTGNITMNKNVASPTTFRMVVTVSVCPCAHAHSPTRALWI